jgi:hypothetical protein
MDCLTILIIAVIVSVLLEPRGNKVPPRYDRLDGPVDDDWQRAQQEHLDHYRPRREE